MPTLSEAYSPRPYHLHHPPHTNLDFSAYGELPDTHAWPRSNEVLDTRPIPSDPVPVVDLRNPDAMEHVARACRSWGVFQITSHGVPPHLLEVMESECWRLFSLPAEQKLKALRKPDGISGYGVARISPFFSKRMWSEGFTIVGSPAEHAKELWPHDHHRFCKVIQEYYDELSRVAAKVTGLILSSLGLTEEDRSHLPRTDDCSAVLQLNSYPACPDPERAMGLAPHTDSSLLTILHQSNTSGLQVLRPDGQGSSSWVTVPPLAGVLVVNVGDLLQILSNGLYRSVLHRAVVNRSRHRLSVAYIYGPPADVRIAPVEGLLGPGDDQGPAYRAVSWAEYLGLKAKHFDKALEMLRHATVGAQEEEGQEPCIGLQRD